MDPVWDVISDRYEIHQKIGSGTFGIVVSAEHIKTKTKVAIKLMKNCFNDPYDAKKRVSEIEIMRKLSGIDGNCFTTHLFDIIVPDIDLSSDDPLDYLFMVMDIEDSDLDVVLTNYKLY